MRIRLAAALLLLAGPASAEPWTFAASPYVWLPAVSTSTATGRGKIDVSNSSSDVLSALDFAFMGAVEARNGRWGLILDLVYADLSANQDTPLGALWSEAKVETKLSAFTTYAGYRVLDNDGASVDLLAGARFFSLDLKVSLEPQTLAGRSRDFDADWADPVLGARGRYDFNEKWFATALADVGGFGGGSDQSWQALATAGYQFNPRWSAQAGWRYLAIEKEIDGQDVEVDLNGPLIGVTVRF